MSDLINNVVDYWLGRKTPPDGTYHCATRDIFQARLDSFLRLFLNQWYEPQGSAFPQDSVASHGVLNQRGLSPKPTSVGDQNKNANEASLLVAIVGETGNNCFDHNLGQWIDVPGCWFGYTLKPTSVSIALADRGQGILSSLKTVEPNLQDEQQALELAFSKAVSGRFPERRGNGLKFVRRVINGNSKRGLFCQSGSGILSLGGLANDVEKEMSLKIGKDVARGTITFMRWESS